MTKTRLLVKASGTGAAFTGAATRSFGANAIEIEPILEVPERKAERAFGLEATDRSTWFRVEIKDAAGTSPWDEAHEMFGEGSPFALGGAQGLQAVEPDFEQRWPLPGMPLPPGGEAAAAAGDVCAFSDQNPSGGKAVFPGNGWNLGPNFSQLAAARAHFGAKLEERLGRVVVAHLDTGFDPNHVTKPAGLQIALQRNFVSDGRPANDASDHAPPGGFSSNRGHGMATLALLAGNRLRGDSPGWPGITDFISGAPFVKVIPIRIADWVVRFTTSTMVQGFEYARVNHADVLSMSMGGFSSAALTDAVNLCYEFGVVLVTAAGNNFAGIPMPRSIVFPARYRRVLAACGVMADGHAYAGLDAGTMQGSFGPDSKMATALGAYTPNVPWSQIDCPRTVRMDGAGTSAATPQIAAAAALWLAEHFETVGGYPERWMRVEAVRHALFASASKATIAMGAAETFQKIGQGVLRAESALGVLPLPRARLTKLPPAQPSFSWLDFLTGGGVSVAAAEASDQRAAMLALELTQMAQRFEQVDAAIADPDVPDAQVGGVARRRYYEAVLEHGDPSQRLRAILERALDQSKPPDRRAPAKRSVPVPRARMDAPPPTRKLRVYALDPSVAKNLEYLDVNETVLTVPWEKLEPGPVGEYIEVVDVDPASDKLYEPVDLNAPLVLAQDGLPPSEGNPAFHQQMVYAVATTTIVNFEAALGRKALWAPRFVENEKGGVTASYVPRLRIYPHALRTDNAYYSPEKKALLFGYFPADSRASDATAPGSLVFSCLSRDIVAHEMSHALLDGLHRHFQDASNPDVAAFHEGFADLVALFQHFNTRELVRFEIARVRGDLTAAKLLGGLARQFGEGTNRGGALRDYLGAEIAALDYANVAEVHARGSILVSAVYSAFLRIVERRTRDLIRLSTAGTGVLPAGAIHPDLVERLTTETCDTAEQTLRKCIRALDYCPAVDITFGEYLRALITADRDLTAEDPLGYRVAFIEAFRARGMLPRDVRTVSEESLAWATLEDRKPDWLSRTLEGIDLGWDRTQERAEIHQKVEENRRKIWFRLRAIFAKDRSLMAQFGLLPGIPAYNSDGSIRKPVRPGETTFDVFGIRPARRISRDGSFRTEVIVTIQQRRPIPIDPKDPTGDFFWFRGGATLILDTRREDPEVRYIILKNCGSKSRLERQRRMVTGEFLSPLRALYFGKAPGEPFALLHSDRGDH